MSDQIEFLAALAWDLRASTEGQLRAITALQRCIDEYRRSRDPSALLQIRKHLREIETRPRLDDALKLLRHALFTLESTHS